MTAVPEATANIEAIRDEQIARILDLYYEPSLRTPEALREVAASLHDYIVRDVTIYYMGTVMDDMESIKQMALFMCDVLDNISDEPNPNLYLISALLGGIAGQYKTWMTSLALAYSQAPDNTLIRVITLSAISGITPEQIREIISGMTFEGSRFPKSK